MCYMLHLPGKPLYATSDHHMVINPTLTLVIPFMSVTNSMMTYLPTGSRTAAQDHKGQWESRSESRPSGAKITEGSDVRTASEL